MFQAREVIWLVYVDWLKINVFDDYSSIDDGRLRRLTPAAPFGSCLARESILCGGHALLEADEDGLCYFEPATPRPGMFVGRQVALSAQPARGQRSAPRCSTVPYEPPPPRLGMFGA
jgi:hypothetical protein